MKYLDNISPGYISSLNQSELSRLADELRSLIIETVSKNGGHLASNLGVVELTIALHRVFAFPQDKLIFDVGHQSYVHKLLSGRVNSFSSLRKRDGISGFQVRNESVYDCFGGGHSGTSVSAALGFAEAEKLNGSNNYAIAVVGDGSFTNGMIHEAINNASERGLRLIIILNDNEMSISKNVGGLSKCFGKLRSSVRYYRFKRKFKRNIGKIKLIGRPITAVSRALKNLAKRLVWTPNFFENLGIDYMGPVDGHDLRKLESILVEAKLNNDVTIVHVHTVKGKGYEHAEKHPELYHSVGSFDPITGITSVSALSGAHEQLQTFSDVFGQNLVWYANDNRDIVAITAAMCDGTGLTRFRKSYPDRFFDVGIAEEHAVTFAAGLAASGKRPVIAVYSSFLQRGYDQLIHDVAIQGLPVVFAIDHAGFVAGDGATHQGIFDCTFLMSIPGISIYAPECFQDMNTVLSEALKADGPVAIRYPKGGEFVDVSDGFIEGDGFRLRSFNGSNGEKRVCLISYGRTTGQIYKAAEALSDKYAVRTISITRLKPMNTAGILKYCLGAHYVYFVEEQIKTGGVGEYLLSEMVQLTQKHPKFEIKAISDTFPRNGTVEELYDMYGMSAKKIEDHVRSVLGEDSAEAAQ